MPAPHCLSPNGTGIYPVIVLNLAVTLDLGTAEPFRQITTLMKSPQKDNVWECVWNVPSTNKDIFETLYTTGTEVMTSQRAPWPGLLHA